jgi:deazaflavin-dependent oxidoreductase (nitroreductase family)
MDMTAINPGVIAEYRRTGGTLSGDLAALPVLLLTTTGRRSGRAHTTPLGYITDGERFVVAASAGGSPSDPDWYRNLTASPSVTVEVGADRYAAHAAVATGTDHDRLLGRLAATLPGMADYAATVARRIPVVVLTPTVPVTNLAAAAARLRSMHRPGNPLLLVNAWDVATARRVVEAGGRAVATSSSAVAASLGLPDDPSAPVEPLLQVVGRIAAAVDVPVTADLLDGYGLDPAELVERLLGAGAVGCNLEDSDHANPGTLLAPGVVAERIAAVRAAAVRSGVGVVINARIDSYLYDGPGATADVISRARRYLDAGADCVYPIRLTDPETVRHLVDHLDAAVNANLSQATRVAEVAEAGASRISIGPMAFRSALATVDRIAAAILGTDREEPMP